MPDTACRELAAKMAFVRLCSIGCSNELYLPTSSESCDESECGKVLLVVDKVPLARLVGDAQKEVTSVTMD